MKTFCFLFLGAITVSDAARTRYHGSVRGSGAQLDASERAAADLAMQKLVHTMMSDDGSMSMVSIIGEAGRYVDFDSAAQILQQNHTLPEELSALLTAKVKQQPADLSEESLTKARQFLNTMVEKAQKELDDKIIEAKEFESRNRGTHAQIVADVARLGAQVADHSGLSAAATSGIADADREIDDEEEKRRGEKDAYEAQYNINFADLTIKQNDLDVFNFLIKATKKICDNQAAGIATKLLQVDRRSSIHYCSSTDGGSLRFDDKELQAKFDNLLSKASHDVLDTALYHVQARQPVLFQQRQDPLEIPKCGPIPDCGLLYDTLSLQWGGFKDEVDKLKKKMDDNAATWLTVKTGFDAQIATLTAEKGKWGQALSEATAAKNGDTQIQSQKEAEKLALDSLHVKTMQAFRDRITYIVQQDICGPTVIRNAVMENSKECPPSAITDCDVTPWTPSACSVACDDRCPELVGCGGTQTLTRDVVVPPNPCGIKCPVLTLSRKCSEFKCPVNCMMSKWSGWSKCSKECGGGVQERTRSILQKPKDGGLGCQSVSDGRPCNTGSCDRACSLEQWTTWSPCSMACGGGSQSRIRKVAVPIRGDGKCPTPVSGKRHEDQDCNEELCVGDELCTAFQDLVIAVDGSGSVHGDGFTLIRNFTGELLKRYRSHFFGAEAMRVGVVLFGNGAIEEDGTISMALEISELFDDMAAVAARVEGMQKQSGFTNMAQAFALADKMFLLGGRKPAQSAILTITDGKPSFLFETREKNLALKEKGINFFNVGVSRNEETDNWKLMEEFASKPASANTVRVPGLDALSDGAGAFVEKALTTFCPASLSPSNFKELEERQGFMLVRKGGYCGPLGQCVGNGQERDSVPINDANECREIAAKHKATSFQMGQGIRAGHCCFFDQVDVTCDAYKKFESDLEMPECSWAGAEFQANEYFDWYAIEPSCDV